jgi:hypothetical protein
MSQRDENMTPPSAVKSHQSNDRKRKHHELDSINHSTVMTAPPLGMMNNDDDEMTSILEKRLWLDDCDDVLHSQVCFIIWNPLYGRPRQPLMPELSDMLLKPWSTTEIIPASKSTGVCSCRIWPWCTTCIARKSFKQSDSWQLEQLGVSPKKTQRLFLKRTKQPEPLIHRRWCIHCTINYTNWPRLHRPSSCTSAAIADKQRLMIRINREER